VTLFKIAVAAGVALLSLPAQAQQTRLFGPDGRSIGTVTRDSSGSTRHFDSRGRSIGTSTTTGGTTTFYDARGHVIGRSTSPKMNP
jgi:hypothetical protein